MEPSDIALGDTYTFVQSNLPPQSSVLEVGCGKGELAARLQQDGYRLLAIDISEEAIGAARARGVRAQRADFVDFAPSQSFDAVVLVRSLHHIHPLAAAVSRAFELLRPGGVLLLDEFDHEVMDRDTARWLYGTSEILRLAEVTERSEFPGLTECEPLEHWRDAHVEEPPLHTGGQMAAAVGNMFTGLRLTRCGYLFRYFCRDLSASAKGYEIASKIFELESSLIAQNRIQAIGFRLIARR